MSAVKNPEWHANEYVISEETLAKVFAAIAQAEGETP